jgi:hypothetical protein
LAFGFAVPACETATGAITSAPRARLAAAMFLLNVGSFPV